MADHRATTGRAGAAVVATVLGVAFATALSGCGSSGTKTGAATTTTTAPTTTATTAPSTTTASSGATGTTPSAVTQAVTTDWETFFSAKTPVARRVALLQDGSAFQTVLTTDASLPEAQAASVKVTNVALPSPSTATVTYNILVSGTTALPGQTGTAVLDNGTWLVSASSFCSLLTLEAGGSTSGLPAACASAG